MERVWREGNPLIRLMGMQTGAATMENNVGLPLKLEVELPYDPTIPLLSIYPEETRNEKDTCIPVFISALFTIVRTGKQAGCPLTDE